VRAFEFRSAMRPTLSGIAALLVQELRKPARDSRVGRHPGWNNHRALGSPTESEANDENALERQSKSPARIQRFEERRHSLEVLAGGLIAPARCASSAGV
jgi:hypothetical protein